MAAIWVELTTRTAQDRAKAGFLEVDGPDSLKEGAIRAIS